MAGERSRWWQDVRAALAGKEQDYTQAPLNRAIVLLAVPMVLEMCMESLFGIVDIFFVARLGAEAAAAVGVTETLMTVVYSVAMGIALATTAMVARRTGEKDEEGAARAAAQAVTLGVMAALAVGIPALWQAPALLRLMGADAQVIAGGVSYTRYVLGSALSVMLLFLINAIFRGAGDAAAAMRVLWFANGVNIALDPLLIFGLGPVPAMGVAGAGLATVIGRSAGVALQVWILARGRGRIALRARHFRPDWRVLRRLSRVSSTGMLQFLIANASWLALVRIIAASGAAALAGYAIAIRIVIFSLLPSWGLSNAAAALVGQNLGARRPERAESAVYRTGVFNMAFLGAVGLAFLAAPAPLAGLFTADAEVIRYAADCLRIVSYGYVFYAMGMVLVQAFNGAGDTTTPTLINVGVYWLLQIPLAWWLALRLGWGADGAFWAIPTAEGALAVTGWLIFRRGGWKKQKI
jgi:putative MATE family efflux protein